jgi:hypothetical protein
MLVCIILLQSLGGALVIPYNNYDCPISTVQVSTHLPFAFPS